MKAKQKTSKKPIKDDVSYVGIPSLQSPSAVNNSWWKRRENSLQQIASYTNYAIPFRQKHYGVETYAQIKAMLM